MSCRAHDTASMIEELETENRLLRSRNSRLEDELKTIVQRVIDRLEAGFGASSSPPLIIRREFLDNG